MTELAVGTQVRTKREAKFTLADDSIIVIEAGSLGTVEPYPLGGRWTIHASVNFSALGGGFYFLPDGLEVVETPPAQPDLAQQLADALERAERAERQVAVLKAFVEEVAGSAPHSKPNRADYTSWREFTQDYERWGLSRGAQVALKALEEKAVDDVPD